METIEERFKEMNMHRVQQKGDKGFSQEYEKYRTVKHKKRKPALPNITSPDMMDIRESECPYDTSTVDIEEGVNNRKDDKDENKDEEKDVEYPEDTYPVDIEEGIMIEMMTRMKKMIRKKRQNLY